MTNVIYIKTPQIDFQDSPHSVGPRIHRQARAQGLYDSEFHEIPEFPGINSGIPWNSRELIPEFQKWNSEFHHVTSSFIFSSSHQLLPIPEYYVK